MPAYKELVAALRNRDTPVPFEELYDKLIDHETFLHDSENTINNPINPVSQPQPPAVNYAASSRQSRPSGNSQRRAPAPSTAPGILPSPAFPSAPASTPRGPPPSGQSRDPRKGRPGGPRDTVTCQYCQRPGHTADKCWDLFPHLRPARPSVHATSAYSSGASTTPAPSPWLLDSSATNHVVSNLSDLQYHQLYDGPDDVVLGNNSTLGISHTGFTSITPSFSLSNVLCVPSMSKNIISVSQFCTQNSTSIEFFPSFFIVKDLSTNRILLQGRAKDNLYVWPSSSMSSSSPQVNSIASVSPLLWHSRLGHPSSRMTNRLLSSVLPSTASALPSTFACSSCLCNKSSKLPFNSSSLTSRFPLDVVFTDVWGPSPVTSSDGFHYYVIFVDHFMCYIWFFPG